MTEDRGLSVPVVFIVFNRPDLTARVFDSIREARPRKLFVIADGPRSPDERDLCEETRQIVQAVDWPCEVRRTYSETNLGCRIRMASALNWVFSRVSEAIVLEDDCLPSQSFFPFCSELLNRYRDDPQVMHIGGSNFLPSRRMTPHSYYFSRYAHIWGWATWSRAWRDMDLELKTWRRFKSSTIKQVFADRLERKHWAHKLKPISTGERVDTWDYSWQYSVWAQRGICVVPQTNLVANIGFRDDATHTRTDSERANLPVVGLPEKLTHPPQIQLNEEADRLTFYEAMEGKRLLERRTWRYRLSKPARIYRKLVNGHVNGTPKPVPQGTSLPTVPVPMTVRVANKALTRQRPAYRH